MKIKREFHRYAMINICVRESEKVPLCRDLFQSYRRFCEVGSKKSFFGFFRVSYIGNPLTLKNGGLKRNQMAPLFQH